MEKWKAIPGYEGIYEASNHGRIRSAAGKITHNVRRGIVHWQQRVLKQHYIARGRSTKRDARVTLWKDKKPHYCLVSRLIARTWCDGYTPDMTVNHIDGNPENNRAENLEWVSLKENIQKGFCEGLYPTKSCILVDGSGVRYSFPSYSEASRFLGCKSGYVSNAIKKQRLHLKGYDVII